VLVEDALVEMLNEVAERNEMEKLPTAPGRSDKGRGTRAEG
jgi:hypothetical protein